MWQNEKIIETAVINGARTVYKSQPEMAWVWYFLQFALAHAAYSTTTLPKANIINWINEQVFCLSGYVHNFFEAC